MRISPPQIDSNSPAAISALSANAPHRRSRRVLALAGMVAVALAVAATGLVNPAPASSTDQVAELPGSIYVVRNHEGEAVLRALAAQPAGARAVAAAGGLSEIHHDGFSTFGDPGLKGSYSVSFVQSPGIETVRPYVMDALGQAQRAAGVQFNVQSGTSPDAGSTARGTIDFVVSDSSPCSGSWLACGGPSVEGGAIVGGRVWINPRLLSRSAADIANTVRHEFGHALGLGHYSDRYQGEVQTMHPTSFAASDYEAGDVAGLRYMRELYAPGSTAGLAPVAVAPAAPAPEQAPAAPVAPAVTTPPTTAAPVATTAAPTTAAPTTAPTGPAAALEPLYDSEFGLRISGWALPQADGSATEVTITIDGYTVHVAADLFDHSSTHDGDRFQLLYVGPHGHHEVCASAASATGDVDLGCFTIDTHDVTASLDEYRPMAHAH